MPYIGFYLFFSVKHLRLHQTHWELILLVKWNGISANVLKMTLHIKKKNPILFFLRGKKFSYVTNEHTYSPLFISIVVSTVFVSFCKLFIIL